MTIKDLIPWNNRGREVGFHDYVAKFDRQGLIAALKEQIDVGRAA